MRRPIVAANWKMHKTVAEATDFVEALLGAERSGGAEVVICPPFTALHEVGRRLRDSGIRLGAQNMHAGSAGAHTGEISATMLSDVGCDFVIVGHSERRRDCHESDAAVNAKARAALAAGLRPILCIGETLEQRESAQTETVLGSQLEHGLAGIGDDLTRLVLAYEPVWAIGTGRTASVEQAQAAHAFIRDWVRGHAGEAVAGDLRIQYGGSVKPGNAASLFGCADVDGGLIGGASLQPSSFTAIIDAAG